MGNDCLCRLLFLNHLDFNPRSRVGNDGKGRNKRAWERDFNPRSRVGNDGLFLRILILLDDFNPRSRVGNDVGWQYSSKAKIPFQSTFPRGERPHGNLIVSEIPEFQSTFPRGERQQAQSDTLIQLVFQSTFPRGERPNVGVGWQYSSKDFNPRSRVGNDD